MLGEDVARSAWLGGAFALFGYLLGSIPVAWLIAWAHMGRDLRRLGSGNVGVMNTMLSVHRWAGLLVLLAELAKGSVAVLVPAVATADPVATGACALAAFAGTRWPVWLGFHGGRGNTCAAASLTLIVPLAVVGLGVFWFTLRWLGLSNFAATRLLLFALPPAVGLVTMSWWWLAVGVAYAVLFGTTHSPETDDHLLLERQFPSLWAFLTAPPRRRPHPPERSE